MSKLYDFTVKDLDDTTQVPLSQYKGKVLLIVNVASKCGFTPQYTELEELQAKYGPKGFTVLGFPCNQFGHQEPGDSCAIRSFAQKKGATFPVFAKIDVNGKSADPLYVWLKSQKGGWFSNGVKWNFTKFLVDRQGNVVERYAPTTAPLKISGDIEKVL